MKLLTTSFAVLAVVAMSCTAHADTVTIDLATSWASTGSAAGAWGALPGVASVNSVSIDVSHTWQGDLDVTITSPTGVTALITSVGGSADLGIAGTGLPGDEATYTFTAGADAWGPLGGGASFGTLPGAAGPGVWSILIDDPVGGDGGSVTNVTLDYNVIPEPTSAALVACLGGLVVLRRRRK